VHHCTIEDAQAELMAVECFCRVEEVEKNYMDDQTRSSTSIAPYLNVQQAFYPSFGGAGNRIVFLSTSTGVPQVWEVAWATGQSTIPWPDQRTFEADRVMGVWCSPAADDPRIIFARDHGGNENAQLFCLDEHGEIELTAGYEHAMHMFESWARDGSEVMFAANRRDPARFDLIVRTKDGTERTVWQNDAPGYLHHATYAPDGRRAVVVRTASSFSHELFEVDLVVGGARAIGPANVRYEALAYADDRDSLLVLTDLESDFLFVGRLDLQTGEIVPVVATSWDIDQMAVSPDARLLAYVVNEDGVSRLYVRELATSTDRAAPIADDIPGVVAWLDGQLAWSQDSQRLAFSYTSATRTNDIFVWGLETHAVAAATRSAHGGLPAAAFTAPELIRYPTFDAREIPAWFFRPLNDAPAPAVVLVHGGPEGQFVSNFNFLVQYLVAQGYAVLAPNVRGSTGYGKAYSHLDDVRLRMDSVTDLAYAARWLQVHPAIDGARVAVYGGSYGGFMVLAALTTYPELWAAGVDVVGISNFVTFLERTSAYRRGHREAEYGNLESDREFLHDISPINHIEKIAAPLLVIHGANDPRVPLNEAQQLVAALDERGVPTQLLVFDDEGHGLVKLKNKLVAYPVIVEFLNEHLRGVKPT
jgi:dipeptidyl aminopeptidase/acylaminoacyl peptidase